MKSGIHPKVNAKTVATCSCGATFTFSSTVENIKTEICSACHPFYTGKQKLVDTAGKVDKFRAKMAKVQAKGEKKARKISESVRAAAMASAETRGSATDSARAVKRVKNAVTKRELTNIKDEESKKEKKKGSTDKKDAEKTTAAKNENVAETKEEKITKEKDEKVTEEKKES